MQCEKRGLWKGVEGVKNDIAYIMYATTHFSFHSVPFLVFGKEGALSCERKGNFHVSHLKLDWIFLSQPLNMRFYQK